jgi:HD superfamily phosphodiesterase
MKEKNIDTKIDELARMVAQGFTDTHKEIQDVRNEFKADMKFLRGDIDIMLDRHIGTFRKDYDELTARVKKLEQLVFAHS